MATLEIGIKVMMEIGGKLLLPMVEDKQRKKNINNLIDCVKSLNIKLCVTTRHLFGN